MFLANNTHLTQSPRANPLYTCYWSQTLLTKILPADFVPPFQHLVDPCLSLTRTLIMILYLSASACDLIPRSAHLTLDLQVQVHSTNFPGHLHPSTSAVPIFTTRGAWSGTVQEATLVWSSTNMYVTTPYDQSHITCCYLGKLHRV